MRKCTQCSGNNLVEARMQRGFSKTRAFFMEPNRKHFTRRGIPVEVLVCEDCKNIMFHLTGSNFEKIYKKKV